MSLTLPLNTTARFTKPIGKNYFQIKENGRVVFTGALDRFYIYTEAKSRSFIIKDTDDSNNFFKIPFASSQYTGVNANINDAMQHIAEQVMINYPLVDPSTFATDTIIYSTSEYFFLTDSYHIGLVSKKNVFGLNTEFIFGRNYYELINPGYSFRIINDNVTFASLTTQLEAMFANPDVLNGEFPGFTSLSADYSVNLATIATSGLYTDLTMPYKTYTAKLTQVGTAAPTAAVLESTFANAVNYSYSDVGQYTISSGSAFSNASKIVITYGANGGAKNVVLRWLWGDPDNIKIYTYDIGGGADGNSLIEDFAIEIKVYN